MLEKDSLVRITKKPCYDGNDIGVIHRIIRVPSGIKYMVVKVKSDSKSTYEILCSDKEVQELDINLAHIYARYAEVRLEALRWCLGVVDRNHPLRSKEIILSSIEKAENKLAAMTPPVETK
jgi:hypothetical protein